MFKSCTCCDSKNLSIVKTFKKPPNTEPNYKIKKYFRKLFKCLDCNHFYNLSKVDMNKIYEKDYSKISYGEILWIKLLKIYNLKKKSDNFHRVNRILQNYKKFNKSKNFSVLDIGSGFGLFLYVLKKKNNIWNYEAIEPDENNVKFIKEELKIKTTKGFIEKISTSKKFNLITLNKVLEHTKKPLEVMKKLKKNLKNKGQIYLEVPDGESATKHGYTREEFFIDHHHVFSKKSLIYLMDKSGYQIISLKKIKEPSGKYTLFAFLK